MKWIFSNCCGSLGSLLKIASNPSRSSSAFAMLVGCVYSDPKKAGTNSVQKQLIKPLLNEKDGPVFKMADDPRITRVGHFIRKTSIDELPQFLNVLFGQIPLRILKTRPEFSEESMGAFALPAKSSTNKKRGVFVGCELFRERSADASHLRLQFKLHWWHGNSIFANPFSGRCARSGKRIHGRHRAWEDEARCLCRRA